jgi:LAO/AO transport system kinase
VLTCSALERVGIDEVWNNVNVFYESMKNGGALERKRSQQAKSWMWKEIKETLLSNFVNHPAIEARIAHIEADVQSGKTPATMAAMELVAEYKGNNYGK